MVEAIAAQAFANFSEHRSLLKNPFARSLAPEPGAKYGVFVVFLPCFRTLLARRLGRRPLFQQADRKAEVEVMA
jgi:hypothetical protein